MPELTIPQKEPAAIISAIGAAVTAIIGVAVAFGVPMSQQQQNAILVAIGPVAILIVLLATRPKVTPTAAVAAQVNLQTGELEAGPAAAQADGTPVAVISEPVVDPATGSTIHPIPRRFDPTEPIDPEV